MSFRKTTVMAIVLSGCLLGNAPLFADHREDCERRIHQAEERLQAAIDKHGEHSRAAEKRRHELEQVREECRDVDRDHDHHDEDHH